jgi:hypothetical protein
LGGEEKGGRPAETVNGVRSGHSLVAERAIHAGTLATELAGGAGFYRDTGLRGGPGTRRRRHHLLQAEYAGRHRWE